MPALETGRVCVKTVGREAGKVCVVLKSVNKSFALVSGPKILTGVKRRNANVNHLHPTEHKVEITEASTDDQIVSALEKSGLAKKLGLKLPSAAQLKAKAEKEAAKAEPKDEKKEAKPKKEKKEKKQ
jgi:large subunit ribosomal protein L14e